MADRQHPSHTEPLTVRYCLNSAARLLCVAEMETNLLLMERLERLADSWMSLAGCLMQEAYRGEQDA